MELNQLPKSKPMRLVKYGIRNNQILDSVSNRLEECSFFEIYRFV